MPEKLKIEKSLDKTQDKQTQENPEPLFATPEELQEKGQLLQALKEVEKDESLEGLTKQKEILLKMEDLARRRDERIAKEKREALGETVIKAKTKEGNEIEINLETEKRKWQEFYNNHNFKDKVEIPEIKLNQDQIKEIQTLIKEGYIDKCAIIPDHLTYKELEPEMTKGYEKTYQGNYFKGFGKLDKLESTKQLTYRLLFYKKVQNLEDDKILKETKDKSPDKVEEYLKQINEQHNTDIQGISLKDYLIIQREFAETTNTKQNIQDKSRHMDERGWTRCLKSRFRNSGRVVDACWSPDGRQLFVGADASSFSRSNSGSRLSRSFEIKTKEKE